MIRFIDLTHVYFSGEADVSPCCAFLNTRTDLFLATSDGMHVFDSAEEVRELDAAVVGLGARCAALVPDGFWGASPRQKPE